MGTSGAVAIAEPSAIADVDRNRVASELFDLHADRVYRLALMILGDRDLAQDVLQDTFLRLLAHLDAQRPLSNARGWLLTVAAHACRDRQRAARRWIPWLAERDTRIAPERADARDETAVLLSALAQLAPRDRLLIGLKAQGLSYQEIAAAAGIRTVSIGRLLARAMDRLTALLEKSPGQKYDSLPH